MVHNEGSNPRRTFTTSAGVDTTADAKPATAEAPKNAPNVSPTYCIRKCFVWSYLHSQWEAAPHPLVTTQRFWIQRTPTAQPRTSQAPQH